MFKCSDEQDEIDMMIGRYNATTKGLQEYIRMSIHVDRKEDLPPLEKYLSKLNMRVFKDLYGEVNDEQAKVMLERVNAHPHEEIPKVITRVALKEEELRNRREAMNDVWAKVRMQVLSA